jgi:hypothetical protein
MGSSFIRRKCDNAKRLCYRLELVPIGEDFDLESNDPSVEENIAVLVRLLDDLDECWRRYLTETSFNISYMFDENDRPTRMEKMTLQQFYDRCGAEWDAIRREGQSKTNDELLAEEEAAVAELREDFLAAIADGEME